VLPQSLQLPGQIQRHWVSSEQLVFQALFHSPDLHCSYSTPHITSFDVAHPNAPFIVTNSPKLALLAHKSSFHRLPFLPKLIKCWKTPEIKTSNHDFFLKLEPMETIKKNKNEQTTKKLTEVSLSSVIFSFFALLHKFWLPI